MPEHLQTGRLLSARDTAAFYGVSPATLWRWTKQGHIPEPVHIGRRVFWLREELHRHCESLKA